MFHLKIALISCCPGGSLVVGVGLVGSECSVRVGDGEDVGDVAFRFDGYHWFLVRYTKPAAVAAAAPA